MLISESIKEFIKQNINYKLWRRFWSCIDMYKSGLDYKNVMNTLFSKKKKKRKIYKTSSNNKKSKNHKTGIL